MFKRLKGKTVTEKVMNCELVTDVIDEQYGNLTQRHFERDGSYRQVTLIMRKFAKMICGMAMHNSPAPTFEKNWKNDFSNETYDILKKQNLELHIAKAIEEMRRAFPNHVTKSDMIKVSFYKIAQCSAISARMLLWRYHPDFIRATPREANEGLLERAKSLYQKGVPVVIVKV